MAAATVAAATVAEAFTWVGVAPIGCKGLVLTLTDQRGHQISETIVEYGGDERDEADSLFESL